MRAIDDVVQDTPRPCVVLAIENANTAASLEVPSAIFVSHLTRLAISLGFRSCPRDEEHQPKTPRCTVSKPKTPKRTSARHDEEPVPCQGSEHLAARVQLPKAQGTTSRVPTPEDVSSIVMESMRILFGFEKRSLGRMKNLTPGPTLKLLDVAPAAWNVPYSQVGSSTSRPA